MNTEGVGERADHPYPYGFRPRRGLNWGVIGLMYGSYYMCRYNIGWATPGLSVDYELSTFQISLIFALSSWAYGIGQFVNGLFTDRIGGKRAMLIGAVCTIIINVIFGAATFAGTFATFCLIWLLNGYVQAFGAPGFIKMNTAWFSRTERGTFSGIFGFMIQLGLFSVNFLAPALLAGFPILIWTVPALHWRWLFWIPPCFVAIVAALLAVFVKHTPEEAGFENVHPGESDHAAANVQVPIKEAFATIMRHPLIWFYAAAYAMTGAVRHGLGDFAVLYFFDDRGLDPTAPAVVWTMFFIPFVAVMGSLGSGIVSDKFFKGARAPVAMVLYFVEALVIGTAAVMIMSGINALFLSCVYLIMISLTANSTHSIVGAAAPMDIGGRKMAGFASGVIDSFQYFGKGLALPLMGWLIDNFGWVTWFPTMAGCGLVGGVAMLLVMRRQRTLEAQRVGSGG